MIDGWLRSIKGICSLLFKCYVLYNNILISFSKKIKGIYYIHFHLRPLAYNSFSTTKFNVRDGQIKMKWIKSYLSEVWVGVIFLKNLSAFTNDSTTKSRAALRGMCSSFHDVWPSELCQEHACLSCIYRGPELAERGSHERMAELGRGRERGYGTFSTGARCVSWVYLMGR